jgi:hypothetical protein
MVAERGRLSDAGSAECAGEQPSLLKEASDEDFAAIMSG